VDADRAAIEIEGPNDLQRRLLDMLRQQRALSRGIMHKAHMQATINALRFESGSLGDLVGHRALVPII
jgi:hypothetical protein